MPRRVGLKSESFNPRYVASFSPNRVSGNDKEWELDRSGWKEGVG